VHVWTINAADDMNRLLDAGVDGIVTDRADIALGVLRSRTAKSMPQNDRR
jgi:glycerophosphoryl diester phosphodiesterase